MKSIRKTRGRIQEIYLLETMPSEKEFEKRYAVMGSTGNVYEVTIKDIPECTCPDYITRGNRCKHIYFILIRVMHAYDVDKSTYSDSDLEIMFDSIPHITSNLIANKEIKKLYRKLKNDFNKDGNNEEIDNQMVIGKKTKDDICPVCLDNLENGSELDFCKYSCGKYIHKKCFAMWSKRNNDTCVFCRSDWKKQSYEIDQPYINLINKIIN